MPEAQYSFAARYLNGEGVDKNKTTAKEHFGKAYDDNFKEGCKAYRYFNEQNTK